MEALERAKSLLNDKQLRLQEALEEDAKQEAQAASLNQSSVALNSEKSHLQGSQHLTSASGVGVRRVPGKSSCFEMLHFEVEVQSRL